MSRKPANVVAAMNAPLGTLLPTDAGIRLAQAFDERPRDERMGQALVHARELDRVVSGIYGTLSHEAVLKVIAEFILQRQDEREQERQRDLLLDAQAALRGALAAAERAYKKALEDGRVRADQIIKVD